MAEPVMTFPEPLAELIAFWVDALLHGMYFLLFLRWAIFNQTAKKGPYSRYYTITTWAIFVLSNIETAINLVLLIEGFWDSTTNGSGGPSAFFSGPLDWKGQWREYVFQAIISLLDLMMTHRLWVIWNQNYYLAGFVCLIWLLELVFGILSPTLASLSEGDKTLTLVVNTQLGLNVGLQLLLTCLISYRIIGPQDGSLKFLPHQQRRRRTKIVQCFVESGALVTIGIIVDLILYTRNNYLHLVASLALGQLYAISSVMIVLRLHDVLARATQPSLTTISTSTRNSIQARNAAAASVQNNVNRGETVVPRTSITFPSPVIPHGLAPRAEENQDEKWQTHRVAAQADDSSSSIVHIHDIDDGKAQPNDTPC